MIGNTMMMGHPIETAHQHQVRSLLLESDDAPITTLHDEFNQHQLKIRAADSSGQRSSANILIHRMYATRGYLATALPDAPDPNRLTLTASNSDSTVGTITIGFDSPDGLHVDDLFREEADIMRAGDRRVCEFTKLAMDSVVKSKRALASLFHVAFIYAYRLRHCTDLLIEVNPRHVRYYERILGFEVKGAKRHNKRVNAPAVMMALDLEYCHQQVVKYGGRPELSGHEKSLYPYCFSLPEEAGIVARLQRS